MIHSRYEVLDREAALDELTVPLYPPRLVHQANSKTGLTVLHFVHNIHTKNSLANQMT
jgi:hypothetical protein